MKGSWQVVFSTDSSEQQEIIIALTQDVFSTFQQKEKELLAHCNLPKPDIEKALKGLPMTFAHQFVFVEDENWNKVWESSFDPISIGEDILVRAPFHERSDAHKYEIIIEPKMAFGTGHHQTTCSMLQALLKIDVRNKSVVDMGCGTGILGIAASMLGATKVLAIDNDPIAVSSAKECSSINEIKNMQVLLGEELRVGRESVDLILSNINREANLSLAASFAEALKKGGELILSGFYLADVEIVEKKCESLGLSLNFQIALDDWVAVALKKA